ncbi:hypothetical protein NliqN6_4588 [Naganishia liquefaciens]|uniref:Uncharacterized protein n=1 Tax=Naganishia liquefaciens TaxID=104408 RepID=A0A8H3TV92_9TREE|nr:hypothetical protein NliqN6_4588 [Naganishia liquefaciens]
MKIGASVLHVVLGTCGVSAWIGRSTGGDSVEGKGNGIALKNHDLHRNVAAIHYGSPLATLGCEAQLISTLKLTCHDTEAERIGVSIALTLCSVSSARQQPPTECAAWTPSHLSTTGSDGWREMPGDAKPDVEQRGRCLEALHRSPQDWSSYNGFLSNAMQLCHALYGKQQEEIARSIYAEISREKMDLLAQLQLNEQKRMAEQEQMKKALQNRIQDLGSLQESAKQQYNTLAALITNSSNSADQANARLLQTLVERRNIDADWWDEVKLKAQEQIEVDAATARREMSVQLNEMRSFLTWLSDEVADKVCYGLKPELHTENIHSNAKNFILSPSSIDLVWMRPGQASKTTSYDLPSKSPS